MERYRHRLANSVHGDPNTALWQRVFRLCQDYLKRAHTYLLERETEFAEVIDVMRRRVGKNVPVRRNPSVSDDRQSERFNRLTELKTREIEEANLEGKYGDLNTGFQRSRSRMKLTFALVHSESKCYKPKNPRSID